MDQQRSSRDLDVVVFGATGFVGRLTADYLARNAPEGVRIGLAGRNRDKLAAVAAGLPGSPDWPLLVADSANADDVRALAERTRVVATTVGPYTDYGMPLVAACAAAGTHYADLTGEVLFVRRSIDEQHETAQRTGARVVHSCGFDSIPSDLGVLALHDAARAQGHGELEDTTLMVTEMRGGISGGTFASMRTQLDELRRDPAARRLVADPYALSPDRDKEPQLGDETDLRSVVRDRDLDRWLAPFVMAAANTRVVRRSNALQDWAYGRRFRYREVMGFPGNAGGLAMAGGVTAGLALLAGGLMLPPTRALLDRVLPAPGEGPSEQTRTNGYFRIEVHSRTSDGTRLVADVAAKGDPGYAATAVMLGESALALALDEDSLPPAAGVLTPATGIGMPLVERLRQQDFTFDVRRRG